MAQAKYKQWAEDPEKLTLLEGWARSGLSEQQIAHNIGINRHTLGEWKKKYDAIRDSLKRGKEVADYEVENELFKACHGYYVEEEKINYKGDGMGGLFPVEKIVTRKYIPPSTTAQIFWLKNRKTDEWRDKREIVDETAHEVKITMAGADEYAD